MKKIKRYKCKKEGWTKILVTNNLLWMIMENLRNAHRTTLTTAEHESRWLKQGLGRDLSCNMLLIEWGLTLEYILRFLYIIDCLFQCLIHLPYAMHLPFHCPHMWGLVVLVPKPNRSPHAFYSHKLHHPTQFKIHIIF